MQKELNVIKGGSGNTKIEISKKIIKLATKRNRIKRMIKENINKKNIKKVVVLKDISKQKVKSINKYFNS